MNFPKDKQIGRTGQHDHQYRHSYDKRSFRRLGARRNRNGGHSYWLCRWTSYIQVFFGQVAEASEQFGFETEFVLRGFCGAQAVHLGEQILEKAYGARIVRVSKGRAGTFFSPQWFLFGTRFVPW